MKFHSPEPQEPFPPTSIPSTRSAGGDPNPVPPLPPSDDPGAPEQDPTLPPDPLHPPGAPVIEPPGPKPRRLGMRVMPTDELDFFLSRDAISALRSPHRGWARMLRSH